MKKKKVYLLTAAVLLAAALIVFLVTQNNSQPTELPAKAEPAVMETPTEAPAETAADHGAMEESTAENPTQTDAGKEQEQPFLVQITEDDPSIAYVLVRMPNPIGLLPLPLEGEYSKTIRQKMPDGSESVNILHLTPNGFRMEDANCEGHDCVNQGEVTLENREERVLWNMVICLPHQLSAELITREEAEQMLK